LPEPVEGRGGGRFFYGWYIVGVAFLSLFLSGGIGTSFSVLLPTMAQDLGWSYTTVVAASSLGVITGALSAPPIGRVVDRRGARMVLALAAVCSAVTAAGSGFVREPWQFYLVFGVLGGASRSAMMNVAPGAMIANWFVRRRAVVSGIAAMGPPASSLVLPPLIALSLAIFSWRLAWLGLGLAVLVFALPAALLLVRRRPEDYGWLPDGNAEPIILGAPASRRPDDWTLHEAIHSRGFWGVAVSMALIQLMPSTVFLFLPSSFRAQGLSDAAAAATLSVMGLTQVAARVALWTPLIAKLGSVQRAVWLWGGLLFIAALGLAAAHGEIAGYLASAFLGLAMGANLVLQLLIWPEYFGRTAVGAIAGVGQLLGGAAGAAGPMIGAWLLDATGSYVWLYFFMASSVASGLVIQFLVGRPQRAQVALPPSAVIGR
jgi:MFS family permease